jgi:hypothetical protein
MTARGLTIFAVFQFYCVCVLGLHANAAVAVKCLPPCTMYQIAITGIIDNQTVEDFEKAIKDPRIVKTAELFAPMVALDTPGGSVTDAIIIGQLIRRSNFMTGVFENAQCSSACVLILAAGISRTASFGKVGIHRPHFDEATFAQLTQKQARVKYDEMANGVRQYLLQMGMSENLYAAMLRVPSDQIEFLSLKNIREYGLEGEDPAWAEYQRAKAIKRGGPLQYEANQSLGRINAACWNIFGLNADRCTQDRSQYNAEIENCPNKIAADYIGCVRSVERRIITKYR